MTPPDDVRQELRTVARQVLVAARPHWRADGPSSAGDDEERLGLWRQAAALGWLGLEVPETLGGSSASFGEVAVILEEVGRALAPGAFVGTGVLGVGALNAVRPAAGRDELLHRTAAGERVLAVAVGDPATAPDFTLEATGRGHRVHGRADFVIDAPHADHLLLVAGTPDAGPALVAVSPDQPGLAVLDRPVLDVTRHLGAVVAHDVEVRDTAVWRFEGEGRHAAAHLYDRGALAVALDSLGVAEDMLEATVAYACARRQFGRPIGSFQAVKHACADMLVALTLSRRLCALAVEEVTAGAPGAAAAVSRAKSHTGATAVAVAGKAMQLHGGFGYTWESGIHAALKRTALNRSLFGSGRSHRARLSAELALRVP